MEQVNLKVNYAWLNELTHYNVKRGEGEMNKYRIEFESPNTIVFDEERKLAVGNFLRDRLGVEIIQIVEENSTLVDAREFGGLRNDN